VTEKRKTVFLAFSLTCFIAIGACVIVNIAMTRQITWSARSVLSIIFGWIVLSPIVVKKYGLTLSLCAATLFVFPFMYFLEKITAVNDWFAPLGLPAAITGLIAIWLLYFLFRFIRISLWFKLAASVYIAGVIANPVITHYVDKYLNREPAFFRYFTGIFPCVLITALFIYLGYRKHKRLRSGNNGANNYEYRANE